MASLYQPSIVSGGSKLKCQQKGCLTYVHLYQDYKGRIEDFKCPLCLGKPVSFEQPILANHYTCCNKCNAMFMVKEDYKGINPLCITCRDPLKPKKCDSCKKFKPETVHRLDPYLDEINDKRVFKMLCDDCFKESLDDI